jgi:hypothetical protein
MDQDGIDDIGLWVPRNSANPPRIVAEWYFRLSNTFNIEVQIANFGTVNLLNHPFSPVPFGADLYAEFGDELAMPVVGNFDPPVASAAQGGGQDLAGDYDRNGVVDLADQLVWRAGFGSTSNLAADGNLDGRVDAADYVVWRNNLGKTAASGSAILSLTSAESDPTAAPLTTETSDDSAVRRAVVDGLFAGVGSDRSAPRPAFRPGIAPNFATDNDDLLLVSLAAPLAKLATNITTLLGTEDGGPDEVVDELLAEPAVIGELFNPF